MIRHGHPVSLNPDHTHFLFVDDGYRGRYGGVAEFRASLERKIARPQEPEDGGGKGKLISKLPSTISCFAEKLGGARITFYDGSHLV